ncbi:MAG: transporter [Microbacterium sp.]|jgi:EmrB/QacA subfamily drug resistance transporter|uniref:DHA2 family efflux MFS transporter permease subunit n=1 Tax=Microbacterium sp. TaxID=51671 RepID=UPI00262E29E3|nr:DHA2 family efflux MFS transporter permease subunit [Microbacterium sp.]MDF2560370.1 transporter [Microbacterium sp.]
MSTATSTPRWRRTVVLALIMGAQLMLVLDTSIVTTALPRLIADLGFTPASLSWVQNAYVLAFGGLLLLGARIGDLVGRRKVFILGVAVFAAASLVAGLAATAPVLLVARVLQGAASAFAIPSTLALLVDANPEPERRSRAIAIYSAVIGAGASVGIIVGGFFTDLLSWRWGLLINVPIGLIVIILAPIFLTETARKRGGFDLVGALMITVGMTSLVYGLIEASSVGWTSPVVLISLAVAALLVVSFVFVERKTREPIVPLSLFANTTRSGAYIARILTVGATFSTFYFLSQYLQDVLHFSALLAGLSFIPLTGMFFGTVYIVGPLVRKFGRERLLVGSLIVALIGMVWLSALGAETAFISGIVLPLLILGVGQGIAIILLTQLGMADVPADQAGAGSGLVNTAHQLGGSVGLAILAGLFIADGGSGEIVAAQVAGYQTVFRVAAGFFALAIVVAVVIQIAARRAHKAADVVISAGVAPASSRRL